jgi:hypothetical protein
MYSKLSIRVFGHTAAEGPSKGSQEYAYLHGQFYRIGKGIISQGNCRNESEWNKFAIGEKIYEVHGIDNAFVSRFQLRPAIGRLSACVYERFRSGISAFSGAAFVMGNSKFDPKTDLNGALADPDAFAKRVHLPWIGVGTEEPVMMHAGIEKLHSSLVDAKIQHIYYESPGTAHGWQTWRRDLKDFAPRLFQ